MNRFISAQNPGAVTSFETLLFPPFQEILGNEILGNNYILLELTSDLSIT